MHLHSWWTEHGNITSQYWVIVVQHQVSNLSDMPWQEQVSLIRWWCSLCTRPTGFHWFCSFSLILFANRRSNNNQFHSLWFDRTRARTHNLPYSIRARSNHYTTGSYNIEGQYRIKIIMYIGTLTQNFYGKDNINWHKKPN